MSRFTLKNYWAEAHLFTKRVFIAAFFVGVLLAVLITRLVYLQVVQHKLYTTLSDQNQLTLIPLDPNRGLIYDKNGILLAENVPTFSLDAVPERARNFKKALASLQKIVTITPDDLKQFQKALKQQRSADGVPLKLNLNEEELARFYLNQYQFPGFHITGRLMRHYPLGDTMVSAVGYVSRINEEEASRLDPSNYAASNYIGKIGLEKYYEDLLHGQAGAQQVETDANGHVVRVLKRIPPAAGANLYLSLDSGLQKAAEDALGEDQGAVVAIEPATGQVLAFVSNPRYDPNIFVQGVTIADFKTLQADPAKPLYNRPLRGLYPPGSTIKPILATQILNDDIASPSTSIFDPGWFKMANNEHIFKDWKKGGHGTVDLYKAIVESCDVYFYTMSLRMGIDRMHNIEKMFGLGLPTGLDVGEELAGVAPSPEWKKKALKQGWYPGDTVNASIGQGYTLVTPLQMAAATATIANRGVRYQPRFLAKWQRADGALLELPPVPLEPIVLKDDTIWDDVINAMRDVVESPHGTAHGGIYNPAYSVAGKTGTAQVFRPKSYGDDDSPSIPKKYRSHSWFISFAPVEKPTIAIAALVENHPHQAVFVTRKVLDYYLLPNHGQSVTSKDKKDTPVTEDAAVDNSSQENFEPSD
jgi:penicillin-binding protein 2